MNTTQPADLDALYYEEYTSREAILKYSKATAGYGISYLLEHDYKDIYQQAVRLIPAATQTSGVRILEFGCGAGMNLLHLLQFLHERSIRIRSAVGTDYSPVLIDAARQDATQKARVEDQPLLRFCVAANETLIDDLATGLSEDKKALLGSFDLIVGVNTIRYSHRDGREALTVRAIQDLLKPGGVCVIIDMNNRFPLFRSALKNRFGISKWPEAYIPTLGEYASPFEKVGFEILRKEHFCWIPHSAGIVRTSLMRSLAPLLNLTVKSRAMRSLVIARKNSDKK